MRVRILHCSRQVSQIVVLATAIIAMFSGSAQANDYTPIDSSNWTLTFDEEFNNSQISPTAWYVAGTNSMYGEVAAGGQEYANDYWSTSPSVVSVNQGNAVLGVTPILPLATGSDPQTYDCAGLNSNFSQQLGYWEARIKMPANAAGMFDAFWVATSLSDQATASPEIDMPEWLGCDKTEEFLHQHFYNFVVTDAHGNPSGPDDNFSGNGYPVNVTQDLSAAYHVYGMLWTMSQITYYLDGVQVGEVNLGLDSVTGDMLFDNLSNNAPLKTILQSAQGGQDIDPNNRNMVNTASGATVFPCNMLVDYVHIYQYTGGPRAMPPAATPSAVTPLPDTGYGGPGDASPIINCGFETGANWSGAWTSNGGSVSVVASSAHSGTYAAKMTATGAEDQIIYGLQPSTSYTLTGWVMNQDGDTNTHVGVKNYDGSSDQAVPATSTSYAKQSVTFTTGTSSTRAEIYVWKNGGTQASYADDFQLTNNRTVPGNLLTDPGFESGNNWPSSTGSVVSSVTGYINSSGQQNTAPFVGKYCASVVNDQCESQSVTVQPNTTYLLSANILNPAGTSNPAVLSAGGYNGSTSTCDAASANYWNKASFPFTTGSNTNSMYIEFWKEWHDCNVAYADSFSLEQVSTVPVPNAGFESGVNWPGSYGNGTTVVSKSQDSSVFDGQYAAKVLDPSSSGAAQDQTITGLQPNTTYTLSCNCRNLDTNTNTLLGVKNFDGSGSFVQNVISSWYYVPNSVTFTTGINSTTAEIFFYKYGGSNASYADDFILYYGS